MLQGWLGNWRVSMVLASLLLLPGAAAYLSGAALAHAAPDYRVEPEPNEEQEEGAGEEAPAEEGQRAQQPLLAADAEGS